MLYQVVRRKENYLPEREEGIPSRGDLGASVQCVWGDVDGVWRHTRALQIATAQRKTSVVRVCVHVCALHVSVTWEEPKTKFSK